MWLIRIGRVLRSFFAFDLPLETTLGLKMIPSIGGRALKKAACILEHSQPSPARAVMLRLTSATFTSRTILPVSSTMQMLVALTDTSNPAKWSMLRFSF
jgi:hypothetical protein